MLGMIAALGGLLAGLLFPACTSKDDDPCGMDSIDTVLFYAGDYYVVDESPTHPVLVGAVLSFPHASSGDETSDIIAITWIEDEVEHSVTWQIESFYWQ